MKLTLLPEYDAARLYGKEPDIIPEIENIGQTAYVRYTTGCPKYNPCNFCSFYSRDYFSRNTLDNLISHIQEVADYHKKNGHIIKRVFLGDGDALTCRKSNSQRDYFTIYNEQVFLLNLIREKFPDVQMTKHKLSDFYGDIYFNDPVPVIHSVDISTFISTTTILKHKPENLLKLKESGLHSVYWGIESGSKKILKILNKISNVNTLKICAEYLHKAGINFTVIILLGALGEVFFEKHIKQTVKLLKVIQPDAISFSNIVPRPGTPYFKWEKAEEIVPLDESRLEEQKNRIMDGLSWYDIFYEDYSVKKN